MMNRSRLCPPFLFALLLLTFLPGGAQASGAFSSRFVSKNFSYSHQDNIRKIFRSGAQARRYFADKERAFHQHLTRALPAMDRLFDRARKKRIPVIGHDVTLPAIVLPRVEDVARVSRSAYPLNLVVRLKNPRGTGALELSFNKAPRPRDLSWLVSAAKKALAARKDPAAPPVVIKGAYPHVCKVAGTFGLYVGALVKTVSATHTSMERRFSAELRRLLAGLSKKFADPASMKALGVSGGLLPLEPIVKKRGSPDPCQAFNPHGPLVDGAKPELVRTSLHRGRMIVIVMIAPRAHDWGKVNPTLTRWLGELLLDKHHERARLEQAYLFVADRSHRHRYRRLSGMRAVRSRRFLKLLSRIVLNRDEPSGLREEAASILVRFDPPGPYRTLVRLVSTARKLETHAAALAIAVKALSAYPKKRPVALLIKIRNNKKADWNLRNDCQDSLKTIAAKLKVGHPLRKKILALEKL